MSREIVKREELYSLLQSYRHTPIQRQGVVEAYKAVKAYIERLLADERKKGHIEGHACEDSIIEIDEDGKVKGCAYKIRQLDLTALDEKEKP